MPDAKTRLRIALKRTGFRRSHLVVGRLRVERQWLAWRGKPEPSAAPRILCYHSVGQPSMGVNDVAPELFRRQLEWALAAGRRFVPASTIARGEAQPLDLAITFDDAMRSVAEVAHPVLLELGIPATVFVVTDWAEHRESWQRETILGWDELGELAGAGVDIGSHAVTHTDFSRLTTTEAASELVRSRQVLEERLGRTVSSFAIPYGQSANWNGELSDLARSTGYTEIYAQSVLKRSPGTTARTFITRYDDERLFAAALRGAFDAWEEWY